MREALCATPEPHSLANIIPPLLAPLACLTWQTDFQRYFIANTKVLDFRANTNNYTCRLMAKRKWLLHDNVAITVVPVVVKIRAAEACGAYADLEVCWAWGKD